MFWKPLNIFSLLRIRLATFQQKKNNSNKGKKATGSMMIEKNTLEMPDATSIIKSLYERRVTHH